MKSSAQAESFKSILVNQSGFTLMELLIVTTILGILASLISIGLNPGQRLRDATQTKLAANLNQASTVIENCIAAETSKAKSIDTIYAVTFTPGVGGCGNINYLHEQNYSRNFPPSISVTSNSAVPVICLSETSNESTTLWYATTVGKVGETQPPDC